MNIDNSHLWAKPARAKRVRHTLEQAHTLAMENQRLTNHVRER